MSVHRPTPYPLSPRKLAHGKSVSTIDAGKFLFEGGLSRQSELQSRKAFGRGPAGGCVRRGGRTWASLANNSGCNSVHSLQVPLS